eukprot:1144606-Pelagomonas_calceolata.AAC.3
MVAHVPETFYGKRNEVKVKQRLLSASKIPKQDFLGHLRYRQQKVWRDALSPQEMHRKADQQVMKNVKSWFHFMLVVNILPAANQPEPWAVGQPPVTFVLGSPQEPVSMHNSRTPSANIRARVPSADLLSRVEGCLIGCKLVGQVAPGNGLERKEAVNKVDGQEESFRHELQTGTYATRR